MSKQQDNQQQSNVNRAAASHHNGSTGNASLNAAPYSLSGNNQEPEDPMIVGEGQMTFDAEGNDNPDSRYFTRTIHFPPIGDSGVTLGRGYDMGNRSQEQIRGHLNSAGVDNSKINLLVGAAGKKGDDAAEFVQQYKTRIGAITRQQQKILFQIVYTELKKDVIRISSKEDVLKVYGATDMNSLHPAILELVVDLRYRGDYKPLTRERIQPLMVANNLSGLATLMANKSYWVSTFGVPVDRFSRRKEFMQNAVNGNYNAPLANSQSGQSDTVPQQPLPTSPSGKGTITANPNLNVRSSPSTSAEKVGSLPNGQEVDIYRTQGTWLQIGEGKWVHGDYVKKNANTPIGSGTIIPNSGLNVRSGAGTNFKRLETLSKGSRVTIYEKEGVWLRIGRGKWVHGNYVDSSNVSASSNTTSRGSETTQEKSILSRASGWLSEKYNSTAENVSEAVDSASSFLSNMYDNIMGNDDQTENTIPTAEREQNRDTEQPQEPAASNPLISSSTWVINDANAILRSESGEILKSNGQNRIIPNGTKVIINQDKEVDGKTMVQVSHNGGQLLGWTMYSNLSASFVPVNYFQSQDPRAIRRDRAEKAGWTNCRFVASEMLEEYLAGENPEMKRKLGINKNGGNLTTGAGQYLRILYEDKSHKSETHHGEKNFKNEDWLMPHAQANEAFQYIDSYLNQNVPVLIGVDHTYNRSLSESVNKGSSRNGNGYNEGTTDHFITLTGVGTDVETGKKFYSYFDPGRTRREDGASGSNRLVETSPGKFEDATAGSGYRQDYHLSIVVLFPSDRGRFSSTIAENVKSKKNL